MATTMKVRITFTEGLLGTAPKNEEIYSDFIGSKAPDASTLEEEIERLGVDEVTEKGMTGFSRSEDGQPILWDYQIKGFFKDACQMLKKVPDTKSGGIKAFKKEIDGLIFVYPRQIPISGEMTVCQRPLRAQTMQGERVTLASSEEIKAGASIEIEVECLSPKHEEAVREWLDYGKLRGIGQWRNSGKGRFTWEELS